eukprot:1858599-Alexandrium_andersonii.AAC.1
MDRRPRGGRNRRTRGAARRHLPAASGDRAQLPRGGQGSGGPLLVGQPRGWAHQRRARAPVRRPRHDQ